MPNSLGLALVAVLLTIVPILQLRQPGPGDGVQACSGITAAVQVRSPGSTQGWRKGKKQTSSPELSRKMSEQWDLGVIMSIQGPGNGAHPPSLSKEGVPGDFLEQSRVEPGLAAGGQASSRGQQCGLCGGGAEKCLWGYPEGPSFPEHPCCSLNTLFLCSVKTLTRLSWGRKAQWSSQSTLTSALFIPCS